MWRTTLLIITLYFFSYLELSNGKHAECVTRRISATFDPEQLQDPGTFKDFRASGSSDIPIAWPEDTSTPITFTLRAADREPKENFRAIVQMSMVSNDPMNGNFSGVLEEIIGAGSDFTSYSSQALKRAIGNGQLFNCFIDRSSENPCTSGAQNPSCCYHRLTSFQDLNQEQTCPSTCQTNGPQGTPQPCQAICLQALVIQVELHLNQNLTGGKGARISTG